MSVHRGGAPTSKAGGSQSGDALDRGPVDVAPVVSSVADELFAKEPGRGAAERAENSRPGSTAVAGDELSFTPTRSAHEKGPPTPHFCRSGALLTQVWQVQDSNLRRQSRRIYSPLPLAARATCRVFHPAVTGRDRPDQLGRARTRRKDSVCSSPA